MSNWISIFILLAVILINGCAAPPKPDAISDFEELCQTLGKTDGKISKEDLLAAVRDREQAEKIFDMCEKIKQVFDGGRSSPPNLGDQATFTALPTAQITSTARRSKIILRQIATCN